MARKVTYLAGIEGAERELTVEVHDLDADPWPLGAKLKYVGTEVPRLDGVAKVTGVAQFTQDVNLDKMAYAGEVIAPHAHAVVKSIDASAARAMPGVLAVRTSEGKRVTYAGSSVAAVCATSREVLADALAAIRVEYDVQPHAVTVEEALKDEVRVSPRRSNDTAGGRGGAMRRGNPDAALESAEVKVEAEYRTAIQTHSALEPHGSVVSIDKEGNATVWASTQATSGFAGGRLLRALELPRGRVRVITEHMGGGFGAKFGAQSWDVLCAEFAKETGRPVKYLLTRRSEHLVGGNRPDSIQKLTLGGTKDGTFTVLAGETWGTSGNGRGGAGCANFMGYTLPSVRMLQHTVSTFTARGAAFRAPRHPQGFFALEGAIDAFAAKAGLDPLAVRMKNDPHPVRQIQWKIGAERIGWKRNHRKVAGSDKGPVKRGVGCAAGRWSQAGRGNWSVDLTIDSSGHVIVMNGAQDLGTGTRTLLAICVAEELGIPPATIDVRVGDTRYPPGPGSGGSTTAPSLGPAAREAGLRAREALAALLGVEWKTDSEKVTLEDGVFKGPGGKKATFQEACGLIPDEGLRVRGTRRRNYDGYNRETAGCQFAEVAVDTETGVITVERVVAVHDAGRLVNTMASRSQVNGGVIQGISFALYEERQLDENLGDMVNPTFDTYKIMGMADCPQIDVVLTTVVSGFNSIGMMGLGEPATVPTAGAIASAVYNAIGVQVRQLPMTPARVLAALEGRQQ
ncbi:MAG: xanthine dehydrogenase family protein molybdopterin-binding subunit [Planctomycetota bacterium]|nr:xanthine dehydrogenase family protein molybdopterin-binding subunit [Planctomycetota bacterium]